MSSHEISCKHTLEEAIKMLYENSDNDESDEEDMSKDL